MRSSKPQKVEIWKKDGMDSKANAEAAVWEHFGFKLNDRGETCVSRFVAFVVK